MDQSIQLKTRDGKNLAIRLTPDTKILVVNRTEFSNVQPNSLIGSTVALQLDGRLEALEISVFDSALRDPGHPLFDGYLGLSSTMSSEAVGELVVTNGREMTVRYKTGRQKLFVPPSVPIRSLALGERTDLAIGVDTVVVAPKSDDTVLSAAVVLVGYNGITPPL